MSKDEKLMILQMVSAGKITPKEGAELLRALGTESTGKAAMPPAEGQAPEPVKGLTRGLGEGVTRGWASTLRKEINDSVSQALRSGQGEIPDNLGKLIGRVFSGAYSGGGNRVEIKEEKTGEFPGEGELDVVMSTANGNISVDTWDADGYRLVITTRANASDEDEVREIAKDAYTFSQSGLRLEATATDMNRWPYRFAVQFCLTLPKDRKASLRLDTANGRVTVEGVTGSGVHCSSANGRISLEGASFGKAGIDTANGRIEYTGRCSQLKANTANGRVEVDLDGEGIWVLNTANGRIEATIRRQPHTAYSLDLSTMMGKMEVSGMEDAEVLLDDSKARFAKRYKAQTAGFSEHSAKGQLKASTAMGRITVSI